MDVSLATFRVVVSSVLPKPIYAVGPEGDETVVPLTAEFIQDAVIEHLERHRVTILGNEVVSPPVVEVTEAPQSDAVDELVAAWCAYEAARVAYAKLLEEGASGAERVAAVEARTAAWAEYQAQLHAVGRRVLQERGLRP